MCLSSVFSFALLLVVLALSVRFLLSKILQPLLLLLAFAGYQPPPYSAHKPRPGATNSVSCLIFHGRISPLPILQASLSYLQCTESLLTSMPNSAQTLPLSSPVIHISHFPQQTRIAISALSTKTPSAHRPQKPQPQPHKSIPRATPP